MNRNDLIVDRKKSWIMLGPPTVLAVVIIVLPILYMLRVSFFPQSNVGAYSEGFTIGNYTQILTDSFYLKVLLRTLLIGLGTGILCTVIAYPVAFHMSRLSARRQQVLTMVIVAPLYTSIVIRCYAWIVILGNKGIVNSLLGYLGIKPVSMLYSYFSVYLGLTYVFLAFMILSIFNVLVTISRNVEEASMIMGASPLRTFIEVTLPLSLPGVFSGFLLVFVLSMGAYVVPELLGGARLRLIPNYIYDSVINTFNWPLGSALAFVYILLTFVVLILYFRIMTGFSRHLTGAKNSGKRGGKK